MIGHLAAVPHPPPELGVNGDGTNDAHRTSPILAVFCCFSCDVHGRFQKPHKHGSLDGCIKHTHARTQHSYLPSTGLSHTCRGQTLHCTSVPRSNPYIVHPSAHFFFWLCIDVSTRSISPGITCQPPISIRCCPLEKQGSRSRTTSVVRHFSGTCGHRDMAISSLPAMQGFHSSFKPISARAKRWLSKLEKNEKKRKYSSIAERWDLDPIICKSFCRKTTFTKTLSSLGSHCDYTDQN